jgi:predicted nucleotidyltransferase
LVQAPLAQTSSADQLLRWLVEQLETHIEDDCGSPRAVVLSGSLARGEGTVLYPGTQPAVLSDIDMAVVYRDGGERDRFAPRLTELAREQGRDYRRWGLLAAIDLGAYALSDLPGQAARPGTIELKRSGLVIAGDRRVLERLPGFSPQNISADEVLLLCENRLLELLWAHESMGGEGNSAFAALYAGGKAVLDAALAWLVSRGEMPLSATARLAAMEARDAEERAALGEEFLDALRFWTSFKLEPKLEPVSRRYHGYREPCLLAREAWREGATHLLRLYRWLIGSGQAGEAGDVAAWRLAATRAPLRRRLRRWMEAWNEGGERGLDWAGIGGLVGRAGRGTPEHLMGASAAALVATAPEMNGRHLEMPAKGDPARELSPIYWSGNTPWEERRRSLVRAWDCWVLRGTRTGEGDAPWDPR